MNKLLHVAPWGAAALLLTAFLATRTHHGAPAEDSATSSVPTPVEGPAWTPPGWLEGAEVSPWALEALDGAPRYERGPKLRARAAFLADLDEGEVLYAKRSDEVFPVASLTKMVSALTLMSEAPALDRPLCVGPEQYPTRNGAKSRFETGACHAGWDWLGAALVASDNRGAMGLATLSGLRYEAFVARMSEVSAELGLTGASWSDPSGIEEDDMASARDMAKAVVAVAAHPTLAMVASAPTWTIERRGGPFTLRSTNRLAEHWHTLAAKTGYTDPARYCFATAVEVEGRQLVAVVLGAPTSEARFADTRKLVEWALSLDE